MNPEFPTLLSGPSTEGGPFPTQLTMVPAPRQGRLRGLLGKLLMGLFCSATVTAMMNLLYIKKAIVYACALVLWLLGWETKPPKDEPKPDFVERMEREAKKAGDRFKKLEKPDGIPTGLVPRIPTPASIAAEQGKRVAGGVADQGKAIAEKVGDGAEKVGNAVKTKADELADLIHARQATAEQAEKESLIARAAELGIARDEAWTLDKLRAEVRRVEAAKAQDKQMAYLEWWAKNGPNGKCPACGRGMRVSIRGNGRVACPNIRCQLNSSSADVRRQGAPPPPRQYPPAFLLWWSKQ